MLQAFPKGILLLDALKAPVQEYVDGLLTNPKGDPHRFVLQELEKWKPSRFSYLEAAPGIGL